MRIQCSSPPVRKESWGRGRRGSSASGSDSAPPLGSSVRWQRKTRSSFSSSYIHSFFNKRERERRDERNECKFFVCFKSILICFFPTSWQKSNIIHARQRFNSRQGLTFSKFQISLWGYLCCLILHSASYVLYQHCKESNICSLQLQNTQRLNTL